MSISPLGTLYVNSKFSCWDIRPTSEIQMRILGQYNRVQSFPPLWELQCMTGPAQMFLRATECGTALEFFESVNGVEHIVALLRDDLGTRSIVGEYSKMILTTHSELYSTISIRTIVSETAPWPQNVVLSVPFDVNQEKGWLAVSYMMGFIAMEIISSGILNDFDWSFTSFLKIIAQFNFMIFFGSAAFLCTSWVGDYLTHRVHVKFKAAPCTFLCLCISGLMAFTFQVIKPITFCLFGVLIGTTLFFSDKKAEHAELLAQILGPARCYCPNKHRKQTCDNKHCDGIQGQCGMWASPPTDQSCWRCSFRWHLEQIKGGERTTMLRLKQGFLGKGQIIEARMAEQLGVHVEEISVSVTEAARNVMCTLQEELPSWTHGAD